MNHRNSKGIAPLVVIGALALIGAVGLWVAKPKALHDETRRADQSEQASVEVKAAHEKEVAALNHKSAEAAASAQVMADVTASLPATTEKKFLIEEGKVMASKLEAPDPAELLRAEQRKNAVLSGKVAEAESLYSEALKHSAKLSDDLADAEAKTAKAQAARDEVDRALAETAALHRGMERQRNMTLLGLALLAALYLWTKLSHLSPSALAEATADIHKGKDAIAALDGVASRFQQKLTRTIRIIFHN
jgi:hypothetical protein